MPSLKDLALPFAGSGIGAILQRRSIGGAQNRLGVGAQQGINTIQQGTNQAISTLNTGAKTATGTIQSGSDKAGASLADLYKQQLGFLDPYANAGKPALDVLQKGTGAGGEFNTPFNNQTFDLYKDPSFQWRLEQGQKAIEAGAAAGGTRFSGATLKSLNDYAGKSASQEYQNAFSRYQTDITGRYNREMGVAKVGQQGAEDEAAAAGQTGANLANLQERTGEDIARVQTGTASDIAGLQSGQAKQIAELQTDLASAQASGDIAKANTITDTINGILKTVSSAKTLAALAPGAATLGSVAAGAVPAIPLAATGSATAGTAGFGTLGSMGFGEGGAAAGTTGGLGSFGAAVTGFLTNPITIGVGAALIGGYALLKHFQVHQTANTFVKGFQNPFADHLNQAYGQFFQLKDSGQLDKATAQQMRDEIANLTSQFDQTIDSFGKKGSKEKKVASQARQTMDKYFGKNWTGLMAPIDATVNALA